MGKSLTDDELDAMGLTDEEREALLEGEDDEQGEQDDGDEDAGTAADGDDDADSGDDADRDDDGANGGETEGDTAAENEGGEDDAGDEADEGESQPRQQGPAPIFTPDDPGNVEERLGEIKAEKDKLIDQFDDGEITAREYQAQLDALAKQEREIEFKAHEAKLATKMAEQQAANAWRSTVAAFLDQNEQYRKSPLMYKTLDAAVRDIAAQEENANLSGQEILAKAHEQIVEQFGLQKNEPEPEPGKKPGRRKIDAPPTLAKVPASDITETENTRWSRLDRLMETDPERYEAEVGKLSDADREAYLQAQ